MSAIARVGDSLSHGGNITAGSPDVLVDSIPVARIGDACHCNEHGTTHITTGSGTVKANGIGVARVGDQCACGAVLLSGSPDVGTANG